MGESMIKKKGRTLIDTRYAPSKLGRYKIQDMKKPCDSSISCIFVSCICRALLGMYLFDKPKFEQHFKLKTRASAV